MLKQQANDTTNLFQNINNYIFKNLHLIIILTTTIFTFLVIEKMNTIGILINFISLDTLSLMIEIMFQKISLFLGLIAIVYIILLSLMGLIFYKVFQDECDTKKTFVDFTKVMINVFFIILPMVVFIDNINIKNYNKDYEKLKLSAIKSYILTVREPSIRIIQKDNNKTETILLLGKSQGLVYYVDSKIIKNILKDNNNTICSNEDLGYYDKVIQLLLLKHNDKYIVAHKRYLIKPINQFKFIDSYPSFDNSFCEFDESNKTLEDE